MIMISIGMAFFQGCGDSSAGEEILPKISKSTSMEHMIHQIKENKYKVVNIEGCEYILYKDLDRTHSNHSYGFMAHKGNCKNPIHQYAKP
jgi:hypothetical protein